MPLQVLGLVLVTLLSAVGDFLWFGILCVFQAVLQVDLYWMLLYVWPMGVSGAMIGVIVSNVVIILASLAVMRRRHGLALAAPSMNKLRDFFSYGMRQYVFSLGNLAMVQAATILLAVYATKEDIGFFAIAAGLTNYVAIVPDTLATVLTPRVAPGAAGDRARWWRRRRAFRRSSAWSFCCCWPCWPSR